MKDKVDKDIWQTLWHILRFLFLLLSSLERFQRSALLCVVHRVDVGRFAPPPINPMLPSLERFQRSAVCFVF